eukprot:scaffold134385_cov40-Tisochrysis_lutea.AAC.1
MKKRGGQQSTPLSVIYSPLLSSICRGEREQEGTEKYRVLLSCEGGAGGARARGSRAERTQ